MKKTSEFKEIELTIRKTHDLSELKKLLIDAFEQYNHQQKIDELLDFIELVYLPRYKAKIYTDNETLKDYKVDVLNTMYHNAISKIEFIEKMILEERTKLANDKTYLFKDGKQVMSAWKFFTETGTVDRLNLSPTHSFELLKQQRNESYPTVKQKFIDERVMNDLITTDFELNQFRIAWLNKELIAVERWLSDSRSTSDQIEILKYRTFCQEEIDSLLRLVNGQKEQDNQQGGQVCNYPSTKFNIDFKDHPNLFKDEYSTKIFCYLIDHYHNGKDKELSNIYQWMENNHFIQRDKRKEYKDLVKVHGITMQKYNRVHSSTEYESPKLDPVFNELKKRFDKEIK